MQTNKNIILCGFMGCGKTTVGKLLAEKTGRQFIDTDHAIESDSSMSISQIFEKYGESYFRGLETSLCSKLSQKKRCVISTGGGLILNSVNAALLKQNGLIVLLDVNVQEIFRRIGGDKSRPLLNSDDSAGAIDKLYRERLPKYMDACDIVLNGEKSPSSIVNDIIRVISKS